MDEQGCVLVRRAVGAQEEEEEGEEGADGAKDDGAANADGQEGTQVTPPRPRPHLRRSAPSEPCRAKALRPRLRIPQQTRRPPPARS